VALRIPDLGIDAPIVAAGTAAADGGLELPADTTSVAWFRDGARPGASGSAVLAAHVDHDGREGVFFWLSRLPAGAAVEIAFADGTAARFVTTADAVQLPKASLPIDEVFRRGGPPVVTLVTCGGPFDGTARSYEDNTIVTAVPM
jgi:sortase (surface protein transpeptidase)